MLETTQRGAGWLLAILFASLQWLALLVVRVVLILVGLLLLSWRLQLIFTRPILELLDGMGVMTYERVRPSNDPLLPILALGLSALLALTTLSLAL